MSAIRDRLKKKALERKLKGLQRTLDDIVEGILEDHKGNDKQIAMALMTAKQQLKEAGAKDEELVKFQDKINAQMAILKAKRQHSQKMSTSLEQVNLGVTPGVEFVDPGDGGGDLININFNKKSKRGKGRKTRRRRKKKGKRKTKRRRKTKRKRNKKKRKTKRR
jgi:hypothetical protein